MNFWTAILFSAGVILWCAYFLGFLGYRADCGQTCSCIGVIEENRCTGLNFSVNQVTALGDLVKKESGL